MASKLDTLERVEVTSRAQWRAWLKKHHTRTEGIWLVHWKKARPDKHIGYDAIVEEALCFGWIDSLPRKLDEERTMLYLSPRKPKSMWSKLNKERIVRMEAEGSMTLAGRAKIEAAQEDGSWNTLDAVDALVTPKELAAALARNKTARKHFEAFPQSARKMILYWIGSARTTATRDKRIGETVTLAAKNIRANQGKPA
jgi:uncharacterized protein YdeI (YjbR/CyaY-like superfamily)